MTVYREPEFNTIAICPFAGGYCTEDCALFTTDRNGKGAYLHFCALSKGDGCRTLIFSDCKVIEGTLDE